MPKEKEFLFGDIIVEKTNLENANKIRTEILNNFPRKWVYVIKTGSEAKYKIGIANQLGFKMSAVELQGVKRFFERFFANMKHNIIIFALFVLSIILSFKTGKMESEILVMEERKKNAKIMKMMLEDNKSFKCGEGFGVYQICVSLAKSKETEQKCRQLYDEFNLAFQCFGMEEEKEKVERGAISL